MMCRKQGLSSFSVDTVVPVCKVWSSHEDRLSVEEGRDRKCLGP